jgi:hypothetical protein
MQLAVAAKVDLDRAVNDKLKTIGERPSQNKQKR